MTSLSIDQILGVWGDLASAYYGQNGFGGTEAEIYAYRLCTGGPLVYANAGVLSENAKIENNREAADNLCALVCKFQLSWNCKCIIDGYPATVWRGIVGDNFCHRAHVIVIPEKK